MKQPKSEPVYVCSVCGKDIAGGSCVYQNKERNRAAYPLWVYAGKKEE